LLLDRHRPLVLSSTVEEDNGHLTADLTNPDLLTDNQVPVARGTVHIFRNKFLREGSCYERIRLKNYGLAAVVVNCSLVFRADFADIFHVRGIQRVHSGRYVGADVEERSVILAYEGVDGMLRRTRLVFDPRPQAILSTEAFFHAALPPHGQAVFDVVVSCEQGQSPTAVSGFEDANARAADCFQEASRRKCTIQTSDARFNAWINRAAANLHMMTTELPTGPYPMRVYPGLVRRSGVNPRSNTS
jgi:glycogen debranching enzyme